MNIEPASNLPSHGEAAAPDAAVHQSAPQHSAASINTETKPDQLDTEEFSARIDGFEDAFYEVRFSAPQSGIDAIALAKRGVLTWLSKATHKDEFYEIDQAQPGMPAGLYRIRDEGGPGPVITIKKHGDGEHRCTSTTDLVLPEPEYVESIRNRGRLTAVIEKDRCTYRLKQCPDCMLNYDSVRGLGTFIDLKADSPETMRRFLQLLQPDHAARVDCSYLQLKQAKHVSPLHLWGWKTHERYKDYVTGIVSGTLTPLGFLCSMLAFTDQKQALLVVLLTSGWCDGFSDSVAVSQSTESNSRTTRFDQLKAFAKTMAGKCIIPGLFIPIALGFQSNLAVLAGVGTLGAAILAGTATIQALANERPVFPAVRRILTWGVAATLMGSALGALPEFLQTTLPHWLKSTF